MSSPTEKLAPALDIDARLTEIERRVNLLVNVTPLNAAEAWADFERSDFGTAPTLRLRPLDFDPDLAHRDLYDLEVENVDDPTPRTVRASSSHWSGHTKGRVLAHARTGPGGADWC